MSFIPNQKEQLYLDRILTTSTLCGLITREQILSLVSGTKISYSKLSNVLESEIGSIDISRKTNPSSWLMATISNIIVNKSDELMDSSIVLPNTHELCRALNQNEFVSESESDFLFLEQVVIFAFNNSRAKMSKEALGETVKQLNYNILDHLKKENKKTFVEFANAFAQSKTCRRVLKVIVPLEELHHQAIATNKWWNDQIKDLTLIEPIKEVNICG